MRAAFLLAPAAALLLAVPARAQAPAAGNEPGPAASISEVLAWAPVPYGVRTPSSNERREMVSPALAEAAQQRSGWRYPVIGMLAGAVTGAALGAYVMASADEYMAAPAYYVTVPTFALIGLALGGAANLIDPP
jgi:hypothetical protein